MLIILIILLLVIGGGGYYMGPGVGYYGGGGLDLIILLECVCGGMAEGGVVEDDPYVGGRSCGAEGIGELG